MRLHYMCSNCGAEMDVSEHEIKNLEQMTGLFQKRLQCAICNAFIAIPDARLKNRSEISGYRIVAREEMDGPREIYAAEHIETHQKVELQVLHSPSIENGESARVFLNAMNRFMKLKHPNLIHIQDAGRTSDGIYFVAWPRVKSKSLEYTIWEKGALELKPALHLTALIGQVLEWLWTENGLIYGHFSPRRIWITPDKNIKLFNPILTPLVKDEPPSFPLDTMMAGMPGFMSPELLSGSSQLDCRSDIYALGVTLYNMLTGSAPFSGLNSQQIQEIQSTASLPDPRTIRPDLPTTVVNFLKSALAHDPNDRPQDWPTFQHQLANLQQDQPMTLSASMSHHSVLIQLEPSMVPPPTKKMVFKRHSRNPVTIIAPPAPKTNPLRAFYGILAGGFIAIIAFIIWLTASAPPTPTKPAHHINTAEAALPHATTAQVGPPNQTRSTIVTTPSPAGDPFEALYKSTVELQKKNPTDYDALLKKYDELLIMTETIRFSWHSRILEERRGIEMMKSFALEKAIEEIRSKTTDFSKNLNYTEGIVWLNHYQGPFSNQTSDLRGRLASNLTVQEQQGAEKSRAQQQKLQKTQNEELTVLRQTFLATVSKAILENNLEQARQLIRNWNTPHNLEWTKTQQDELLGEIELLNSLPEKIMERYKTLIGKTITLELISGAMKGQLVNVTNQELTIQPLTSDGEVITLPVSLSKILPKDVARRLADAPAAERHLLLGFYALQHNDTKTALACLTVMTNSLMASALTTHIEKINNQIREEEAQKALNAMITLTGLSVKQDNPESIATQLGKTLFSDAQCLKIKDASQRFTELHGRTLTGQKAGPILAALNSASSIMRKTDLETVDAVMASFKTLKAGDKPLLLTYRLDEGLVCLDLSENKALPDLSSLKVLPFKELSLRKCGASKLPVLEGFRIMRLDLSDSAISNLSGIKEASIDELVLSGTPVVNLHALKSLSLHVLQADNCPSLCDLSGLNTTSLTSIVLTGSSVSDLSPLENAPLISANFSKCSLINDLKPLAKCPLTELTFARCNRISMIYALKGLPLRKLDISGTTVSDLAPLTDMPLESLNLADTKNITDLSPLASNTHLVSLILPNDSINANCLRQHKTIGAIGYPVAIEAARFWQRNP